MSRARARARKEAAGGPNQWFGYMQRLLKAAGKNLKREPKRPLLKKPIVRGRSLPGEPGAAEASNSPFINDRSGPSFATEGGVGRMPSALIGYQAFKPKETEGLDGLDELEKGASVTRKDRTGWNSVGLRRFRTGSGREVTGLVLGKGRGGNLFFITLQPSADRPQSRKKRRGRPSAFKNEEFSTLSVKPSNEVQGASRKTMVIRARPSLSPTVSTLRGKGLVDRVS